MSKYLSIESIKKDLAFLRENGCTSLELEVIEQRMEYAVPAADVVPLVRGSAGEKYMSLSAVHRYLEHLRTGGNCCFMDFRELAHRLETEVEAADVAPVVHGIWVEVCDEVQDILRERDPYIMVRGYRCSKCGRFEENMEPYCHCGAKMDGGNNGN